MASFILMICIGIFVIVLTEYVSESMDERIRDLNAKLSRIETNQIQTLKRVSKKSFKKEKL